MLQGEIRRIKSRVVSIMYRSNEINFIVFRAPWMGFVCMIDVDSHATAC